MIFCPDGIIPDSGLTGLNNIYIYIYIYGPSHMAMQKQNDQLKHTYIQHLCEDTGCSPEHLPEAMNDREK